MKYLIILTILIVSINSQDPPDCTGPWCPIKCPRGTYRYAVGCDYLQPEPTCKNPSPIKSTDAMICDYQACYCSPPTVRDERTKKCVRIKDCPRKPHKPVTPTVPVTPRTPAVPTCPPIQPTPLSTMPFGSGVK